jgi:formamidopyrimidine-DNA glycosylase
LTPTRNCSSTDLLSINRPTDRLTTFVPEGVEIEIYRRALAPCIGRVIAAVNAPDGWYLKGSTTAQNLVTALQGTRIDQVTRIGKLLRVRTSSPTSSHVLGLRFGMTGRPIVDQKAAIDDLLYTSNDYRREWVRFGLHFESGSVEIVDPRRLGGVELDPIERLGPDLGSITKHEFQRALSTCRGPIKAALLDQTRIAGIGNLIADEVLWRCSLAPNRLVPSLTADEHASLHRAVRATYTLLLKRGGSHLGDHVPHRHREGVCPADGTRLSRATIGGRTTYWCPAHQR